MTLVHAKITDWVVADEYASVCEQIDALYTTTNTPDALPVEAPGVGSRGLAGSGWASLGPALSAGPATSRRRGQSTGGV